MDEFLIAQNIIDKLYFVEFSIENEKNRYLQNTFENKKEFIEFYVNRFNFYDKIKPINTNNLTLIDVYKIHICNIMWKKLYTDCIKSPFFEEICFEYNKILNQKS